MGRIKSFLFENVIMNKKVWKFIGDLALRLFANSRITALRIVYMMTSTIMWAMMSFLTDQWKFGFTYAAAVRNIWSGLAVALPLVLVHVADTLTGDFYMSSAGSLVYSVGIGLLSASTPPTKCINLDDPSKCAGVTGSFLYAGLVLTFVGLACIETSLSNFEIRDGTANTKPSRWFTNDRVFGMKLPTAEVKRLPMTCKISNSSLITVGFLSLLVPIYINVVKSWHARVLIATVFVSLQTINFIVGKPTYRTNTGLPTKPEKRLIVTILRVLVASASKICQPLPLRSDELYREVIVPKADSVRSDDINAEEGGHGSGDDNDGEKGGPGSGDEVDPEKGNTEEIGHGKSDERGDQGSNTDIITVGGGHGLGDHSDTEKGSHGSNDDISVKEGISRLNSDNVESSRVSSDDNDTLKNWWDVDDNDDVNLLTSTRGMKLLDKAAIILGSPELEKQKENRWTLCSVQEVELTKMVLRMFPMWTTCLLLGVVSSVGDTYFLAQAKNLDRTLGALKIPLIALLGCQKLGGLGIGYLVGKLTDKLKKIKLLHASVGVAMAMVFAVICCVVAALVEKKRLDLIHGRNIVEKQEIPMSIFWLLPQFVLLGGLDTMFDQGNNGLSSRFPKRVVRYMALSTKGINGLGRIGGVLTVFLVATITKAQHKDSWFQSTLNQSQLDQYYWLLAEMSAIALVAYVILACWHFYRESDRTPVEQ